MTTNKDARGGSRHSALRWAAAPLISGDWFDILPEEADAILTVLSDYLETAELPVFLATAKVQRMRAMTLAVYPDWLLVECQAQFSSEAVVLFNFLLGPTGAILLDGNSQSIHALNHMNSVRIADPQVAAEYLTFYCSVVRSGLGRFEIVASIGDLTFSPETTKAQKAALRRLLTTPRPGPVAEGVVPFECTVRYGDKLFRSKFLVPPDGRVQMVDDQELEFDATLTTEQFEGPFRMPVEVSP